MEALTSFAPGFPADAGSAAVAAPALPAAAVRQRLRAAAVPLCYLLAAVLLTWRLWADPAARMVAGNPHDSDLFAWFMRYAAAAVRHGRLPALVTTGMNAPTGVNLMWNTPLLLPGILLAPVTGLFGPQVSLTILTTAGFAGSAVALYWVLRRWGISQAAAALGGAVYGFSPALLTEAMSHYNLQLVILPPLIIDAGLRLAIGPPPARRGAADGTAAADSAAPAAGADLAVAPDRPRWQRPPASVRTGAWLGLLVTAQIFISEEIAVSTATAGVLIVAVLAAARPRAIGGRIRPAAAGLLTAAVTSLALAGHALLLQFHGPLAQHGALYPLDYYVNDVTGFVTPQGALLFHTAASAATAASYQGGSTEYVGYLGWPLLVLLAAAAAVSCRRAAGLAASATFLILSLFSLGGHPLVGGTVHDGVSLPWHWIEELPVISTALPNRMSIMADGAAAVLLAIGIDEISARFAARRTARAGQGGQVRAGGRASPGAHWWQRAVLGVAVLGCLPLLPRPLPAAAVLPLPAGWNEVFAALRLPSGTRVLVVPVPINFLTPAVRWVAESGRPDAMAGGYFIGPGASNGQPYVDGYGIAPTTAYLDRLWAAGLTPASPYAAAASQAGMATASAAGQAGLPASLTAGQLSTDLRNWRPGAVVADAPLNSPLGRFLDQQFGPPAVQFDGMTGWRLQAGR